MTGTDAGGTFMPKSNPVADSAINAIKLGAYDYILKPFDPDELGVLICNLFQNFLCFLSVFRDFYLLSIQCTTGENNPRNHN